jgi:hypothetical protein
MMVESTLSTKDGLSTVVEHQKTLEKTKAKTPAPYPSKSKKDALEWSNDTEDDIESDEEWEDPRKGPPSTWDPKTFDEQTSEMGFWKEQNGPRRVQDLSSPTLADVPPEERKLSSDEEEEWPFQSACAFEEMNRRKRTKSHQNALTSDNQCTGSKSNAARSYAGPDSPPAGLTRKSSEDLNEETKQALDDGSDDIDESDRTQAWKMRETWKSSSHSKSSNSETSGHFIGNKKGRKSDVNGAESNRSCRPDASDDDDIVEDFESNRPEKPKRKAWRSRSEDRNGDSEKSDDDADLGVSSFHGLRKDADKKTTRSNSRGRRTPTGGRIGGSARNKTPRSGRPSRRKMKGKDPHQDEEGEIERVERVRLKSEDNGTPSSRSSRERRRARQRAYSDDAAPDYEKELTTIEAPSSGGRRPPSGRAQVPRSSSERFRRAVEDDDEESEAITMRAQETLCRANNELSQSAHGIRRHHGGGGGLDRRSYHGIEYSRRGQEMRRTPRKPIRHYDNVDSAGSFGGESYDSYEDGGSVYSARTLESIEDYEEITGMDFQTPGMIDFDAEVLDLMQRANPETTAHLDRRVNRKREQVLYDQNMPMMTRQALLTRQASALVQRQVVDGSNIDRRRLLLRSDSMSSVNSHDDLTMSNHRSLRGPPGRRAPPRSRSSGLGAMVPGGGAPRPTDPENRRGVFRTRSSTGTNSFKQYPNKPNRVQSISRRNPGDQIEPHSMRGPSVSNDSILRRRSLQRAKSTTSLRRASDHRVITPKKADRRLPGREDLGSDESGSESDYSDVVSDEESLTPSPRKQFRQVHTAARHPPPRAKSDVLPRMKPIRTKSTDKKDMTNKRNRRKLHLLMYESKMGIEMRDLFKKARDGVAPRSPIKTLMMPSP